MRMVWGYNPRPQILVYGDGFIVGAHDRVLLEESVAAPLFRQGRLVRWNPEGLVSPSEPVALQDSEPDDGLPEVKLPAPNRRRSRASDRPTDTMSSTRTKKGH